MICMGMCLSYVTMASMIDTVPVIILNKVSPIPPDMMISTFGLFGAVAGLVNHRSAVPQHAAVSGQAEEVLILVSELYSR